MVTSCGELWRSKLPRSVFALFFSVFVVCFVGITMAMRCRVDANCGNILPGFEGRRGCTYCGDPGDEEHDIRLGSPLAFVSVSRTWIVMLVLCVGGRRRRLVYRLSPLSSAIPSRFAVNPGLAVVPEGLAFAERLSWISLAGSAWCARPTAKRRR